MAASNVIPMHCDVARPRQVFAVPKRVEVVGTRGAQLPPLIRRHLLELRDWPRNGRVEIDFSGTPIKAFAAEHGEWSGRRGIGAYGWRANWNRNLSRRNLKDRLLIARKLQKNDGRAGRI